MRGPDFLALFIGFCVLVYFAVSVAVLAGDAPSTGEPRIRDPYVIAYLRGDLEELVRVAALSLVLRGLLKLEADGVRTADPTEIDRVEVPIEKVILAGCRERCTLVQLERNAWVRSVGQETRGHLTKRAFPPPE